MAREAFENRVVVWICSVGYPGALPLSFGARSLTRRATIFNFVCEMRLWNMEPEEGMAPPREETEKTGDVWMVATQRIVVGQWGALITLFFAPVCEATHLGSRQKILLTIRVGVRKKSHAIGWQG